jgi:glycerate kinase
MTGGKLLEITSIDVSGIDPRLHDAEIQVALDVQNTLLGPDGAAAVFGPQKGATPEQVQALENGLEHLASFVPNVSPEYPGAGAAGGLGWGLKAFCGAELVSGIDLCLDTIGFDSLLDGADLVLTGEGSFDRQSLRGKAPVGVATRARTLAIPTVVLAGNHSVPLSSCRPFGIIACHSLRKDLGASEDQAIREASILLEALAERVMPGVWDRIRAKVEKRAAR